MIIKSDIVKNNALIQINANLSINEQKIFNFILFCVREKKLKDNTLLTSVSEINKFIGIYINHKQIRANFSNMISTTIEVDILEKDTVKWELSTLIRKVKYNDGYISILLEDELVKNILEPNLYTHLDFRLINQFKSKFSIRVYELAMSYISKKNIYVQLPKLEIDTFKLLMGIDIKNQYTRFAHLKSKVIDKAVSEINETSNIKIDYTLIKSGNKYSHIKFHTKFKNNNLENNFKIMEYQNPTLLTFIDDYLPKYANNKIVGSLNGDNIIYSKNNNSLTLKQNIGDTILKHDVKMDIFIKCYEDRENFEWFNKLDFEQILYDEKEKAYADGFKK
nr:replication initiation protein [uncultured Sulfurimonas sp.]